MKGSGRRIKGRAWGLSSMETETSMMGIGNRITNTDKEFMSHKMETHMRGNGNPIKKKVKGNKNIEMGINM